MPEAYLIELKPDITMVVVDGKKGAAQWRIGPAENGSIFCICLDTTSDPSEKSLKQRFCGHAFRYFVRHALYISKNGISGDESRSIDAQGGAPIVRFDFDSPPLGGTDVNLLAECERQLRPMIQQILDAAVAAGWSQDDVLLTMVDLSWDMYEKRRGE